MGREVRRVPADWQHPKIQHTNFFGVTSEIFDPLHDGYNEALAEWLEGQAKWAEGLRSDWRGGWIPIEAEHKDSTWEDWSGERPDPAHYMPDFPAEERTHWQMYEDTSEGTPISPVMETPEELARWLVDNGASAFASMTATYEWWLRTIGQGSAPSAIISGGVVTSGVAAEFPKLEDVEPGFAGHEDEVIDQDSLVDAGQGLFEVTVYAIDELPQIDDGLRGARHFNFGHPWTRVPGWDVLELQATTEEGLTAFIKRYEEEEFWKVWIRDNTGKIGAVLYKPSNASAPWEDPIRESEDNG
jgi:hypothetical protein